MADTHDRLFDLLANPRRQLLLGGLVDRGGEAALRDLSREIAARETGVEPEAVEAEAVTRVYISLHQTHVPALRDAGLVEYDESDNVVALDGYPAEVTGILEDWDRRRRRWARYYLLVALSVVGVTAASGLGLIAEDVLAAATVAAAVGLLVLSVAHYYATRVSPLADHPFGDLAPLDR